MACWIKNKIQLEEFVRLGALTNDQERILRTYVAGWSVVKQAGIFLMSTSTVDRIRSELRQKYDSVQPYSDLLPPRKT